VFKDIQEHKDRKG